MSGINLLSFISIDAHSITPRYLQLAHAMLKAIDDHSFEPGSILPSINQVCYELEVSRDTVDRAYKHLKQLGVIEAVHGKGYFISDTVIKPPLKICLLFNKLSTHKKIIYDSFVQALGERAMIDFYIYNNDFSLFKKLLGNLRNDFSHYVIIPHFLEDADKAHDLINQLPKHKLVLMSKFLPHIQGSYAAVFEDFENDIYQALYEALQPLKKYHSIKIIFPGYTYHPREILNGFYKFCSAYHFNSGVIETIQQVVIEKGTAYISMMENDLVLLIEKIMESSLVLGQEVGVISYNETPLKKIILNGITTISSDFELMGKQAARLILDNSTDHIAIPFHLTLRASL